MSYYEHLIVQTLTSEDPQHRLAIGWIQFNRPKALNALCRELIAELNTAMAAFEAKPNVGAIVLTGNDKAFVAGGDIKEFIETTPTQMHLDDPVHDWECVARATKPVIAAVQGFALGGGCELMMMCDMVIAGEGAKFGQPEVLIGVIPGAGATQRLTRAVGKARAMELMMTGRRFKADEAYAMGLLSQVVPDNDVCNTAKALAFDIAAKSAPVLKAMKQCINQAYETTLSAGIAYERQAFHLSFASADKAEGMGAFADKRAAVFTDQ